MDFRWNWWNREQVMKHGFPPDEAEHVVRFASRPYPRRAGRDKWYVVGRGTGDRFLEAAFLVDPDDTIFVIHAMPLGGRRRAEREGTEDGYNPEAKRPPSLRQTSVGSGCVAGISDF